jgi:hypothetical protein
VIVIALSTLRIFDYDYESDYDNDNDNDLRQSRDFSDCCTSCSKISANP